MKWEYMRYTFSINENHESWVNKLNKFGEDQWELVTALPVEEKSVGLFDSGSETQSVIAIFKRPKE
jgi:hypothetical protein